MRKLIILFVFFPHFALLVHAQQKAKAENLIVVTFDGYRWKEMFRGADSSLLNDKQYVSQKAEPLKEKYWAETAEQRREKLMPFIWKTLAKKGRIYGNRDAGNLVNVKNRYWFSYPGYNEMFTGYPDTLINSNDFPPNPNEHVFEFINRQKGYQNKVAAFTSWEAFNRILNEKRCGYPINAGYENFEGKMSTPILQAISAQQHYLPKIFGANERPDAVTFSMAKEYLKANHPKVLQLSFIDTDAFGHQGKYDYYLDAAHYNDAMLAELWDYLQSDPFYKGKTTLFIAVDHGRGDGEKWKNHSATVPHSNEVWFAAMGPGISAGGEQKNKNQLFQYQYAKTLAAFLGFDFTSKHPVGPVLPILSK